MEGIGQEQMFPLLVEADPSFEPIWQSFLEDWKEETVELPLSLALDDFARHLILKLESGDTARFLGIFAVIERLHLSTDSYVASEIIGLGEALLDTGCYTKLHPYDFEPWLGPETKRAWLKTNKGYYGREWPTER